MSLLSIALACLAMATAFACRRYAPDPLRTLLCSSCVLFAAFALLVPEPKRRIVAQLKGVRWKRSQFCRGWLITGDTGSGKTSSGINQLLHQVFQNEPCWGGLCIDEKGVYWETLKAMAVQPHRQPRHSIQHLR